MKKFSFSLEAVQKFKEQVLNGLQNEFAVIAAEVVKKEGEVAQKETNLAMVNDEYNHKQSRGISVFEINYYQAYLKRIQKELELAYEELDRLYVLQEEKLEEMVESKKENMTLEKLKDKRWEEYQALSMKNEERLMEEFVVNHLMASGS